MFARVCCFFLIALAGGYGSVWAEGSAWQASGPAGPGASVRAPSHPAEDGLYSRLKKMPYLYDNKDAAKKEIQGAKQEGEEEQEQQVKPLRTKKMSVAFGAIIVGDIAYCAVVNGIMTYTSSFAESLGIASSTAAFMLTVYNVGCFVGSMAFVVILRKVREQTVLLVNSVGGVAAIILMLLVDQIPVYFACLAIAGFFLGVLFSVYVTIATRIDYKHVSRAASLMGTAGGGSDILTPVITGAMVGLWGVRIAYVYVIIMSAVSILAAIVLRMNTSEEEDL